MKNIPCFQRPISAAMFVAQYICALVIVTNQLTFNRYIPFITTRYGQTQAICDFYLNEVLINYVTVESMRKVLKRTLTYQGSMMGNQLLNISHAKLANHPLNGNSQERYFAIDQNSRLHCYKDHYFNETYVSPFAVADAAFLSKNTEIVYINQGSFTINKFNMNSSSVVSSFSQSNRLAQQIVFSNGLVLVYSQDKSNISKGYLTGFTQKLAPAFQIMCNFIPLTMVTLVLPIKYNHTLTLSPSGSFLVRTYSDKVEIWNTATLSLNTTITQAGQVHTALICMNYLIVQLSGILRFYSQGSWIYQTNTSFAFGTTFASMKCFQAERIIIVYSPGSNASIQYINVSQEIAPNLPAMPKSTFNINSPQPAINMTSQQQQAAQIQIPIQSNMSDYYQMLLDAFKYLANLQVGSQQKKIIAQTIGVASASNIGAKLVRPLASLFEEFMLYGYHQKVYPQTVEMFINQMDILAYLKIKPSFINIKIQSTFLSHQNNLYLNESDFFVDRAPDTFYFSQTLNQVFLGNFVLAAASYAVNFILSKGFVALAKRYQKFKKIRGFLRVRAVSWNLIVVLIGPNIRTLAFFSLSQMLLAVSYSFIDKINLILAVLVLAAVVFYTFCLYLLLYQFVKKRIGKQLTQANRHKIEAYVLSLALNCARSFFQGLFHAAFTSNNKMQILGLFFVDLASLALVIKLRKQFNQQIQLILSLMYFVAFMAFNLALGVYVFGVYPTLNFEVIFMFIIFALSGAVVLTTFYEFGSLVYGLFQANCRPNQIKHNSSFHQRIIKLLLGQQLLKQRMKGKLNTEQIKANSPLRNFSQMVQKIQKQNNRRNVQNQHLTLPNNKRNRKQILITAMPKKGQNISKNLKLKRMNNKITLVVKQR